MPVFRFVILFLLLASTAFAQGKDSVITDGASGAVAPLPRWRTLHFPPAGNGLLDFLSGRWRITASLWLAGPDKPPVKGEGYGWWHTVYGSRFLEIADSISVGGQTLETSGYMSWDDAAKHLQLEFGFSANTARFNATGTADSLWHDVIFVADTPRPVRLMLRWIDNHHRRLEGFAKTPRGREYKFIDADYHRSYGP